MPRIAVVARVRVKDGKADEFLAAFDQLLDAVNKEPGTLLYMVQRSNDDPHVFWTSEVYTDAAAFEAHRGTPAQEAATPKFSALIAESDVIVGEPVLEKGLAT